MSAGNKNGIASKDYLQRLAEGSGNVDASGNFSIEVLRSALLTRFNLTLANTMQETVRNVEITSLMGSFAINKVIGSQFVKSMAFIGTSIRPKKDLSKLVISGWQLRLSL